MWAGITKYHSETNSLTVKPYIAWPLDQPRATFGTVSGFWNLQARTKHVLLPDNLKRGGESVISGIPDWTGLILTTSDGQIYAPGVDKDAVTEFYQSLSIRNGLVHTNVTWSPTNSLQFQLNFTVLAHRTRPNVGIVRLDLSTNRKANCSIIDVLDGAGAVRARFNDKAFETTDNAIWTSVKPIGIDYKTAHVYSTVEYESADAELLDHIDQTRKDATRSPWVSRNSSTIAQSWDLFLDNEKSVTLYKYVGIASDDAFPRATYETAMRSALEAKAMGWNSLLEEHELAWDNMWESADIIIFGDIKLQTSVRASLFHILSSLRSSDEAGSGISDSSIAVGGLSSDSYAGLVFWDADTWVYPSILALHPSHASTINNYRSRLLPQAIQNAKFYNYSGALYPWTSGRFGNCTGTGVCKDYQYHLNTDIALAHWQYFQSTRDFSWLREKGWPIIKNVADMFAAYVVLNETTKEYETILLGEPVRFKACSVTFWYKFQDLIKDVRMSLPTSKIMEPTLMPASKNYSGKLALQPPMPSTKQYNTIGRRLQRILEYPSIIRIILLSALMECRETGKSNRLALLS